MINFVLLFSMFLFGIILFALKSWFFSGVVFVSFLFGLLFSWIIGKIGFKPFHKILIYISLWLSIIGEIGLYERVDIYDKLLHFIVPFFLAYLVNLYLSKHKIKHKGFIIFFVVLGIGSIFEVFEFVVDSFLGTNMGGVTNLSGEVLMDEWRDTIWDLIATMFGTIFFFIVNFFKNEKTKIINSNNYA